MPQTLRTSQAFAPARFMGLADGDWWARAKQLVFACSEAEADSTADLLREAAALLVMAPVCVAERMGDLSRLAALEPLLAAGACESAALMLVPADVVWTVTRGGEGFYLANMLLPGGAIDEDEAHGCGESAALALVCALINAGLGALAAATGGWLPEDGAPAYWLN